MFRGAESCAAGALHRALLLAHGVLLLLLLMLRVGVHFMVLLVLPMRVHLVVLRMSLQFVARRVGQHGLQEVRGLVGLIAGGVQERRGALRLRMLRLDLGRFTRVGDFGALLFL